MKNEKVSKASFNAIPTPVQNKKFKIINKFKTNFLSKEKNSLKNKYSSINKKKNKLKKKNNDSSVDIEAINRTENKISQKFSFTESKKAINIQEINNNQKFKKFMLKHKTSSNINNPNNYNHKTPSFYLQNKKYSKLKMSNIKLPKNKNDKSINSYLYKKSNNLDKSYNNYLKTPYHSNKNLNIINQFIKNKINIKNKNNNFSFNFKEKKLNLKRGKIFSINNISNSAPLLVIKKIEKPKSLLKIKASTQKLFNQKLIKKNKEISFLLNQKQIFQNKRNTIKKKKLKNDNSSGYIRMSLYNSYLNKNKKSLSKIKAETKTLTNLKKQNIFKNRKKGSTLNISYNKDRNSSFTKLNLEKNKNHFRIETEPKVECLTVIEEDKKLNKNNHFNFLHHYLLNTISTKNKIVLKKPDEKSLSIFQKEENKDKSMDQKSKSKIKNVKRYSVINRNSVLKFDKILKSKDNDINTSKNNDNSLRRVPSTGSRRNTSYISYFSELQKANNLNKKIFNGKIDDYQITKELGKGSYATVKLGINKNNKNKYAIKIYSRESLLDPQKRSIIKNEINILKQLDNINIMKLYEEIDTPKYLYLVMEYINGISLLEILKKDKYHYFEEKRAIKIFIQIVKGISYCQSKNICHRDIKLENILLVNDDIVKIIDFGFAVKATKESYQKLLCGTPSYMAPEIVNKERYIAQYSDVWSLGVLLFAMLYGRFPFRAKSQEELFEKISEANIVFPDDIEINYKLKELLKKIFVIIPTQRISLNEILNELKIFDNESI